MIETKLYSKTKNKFRKISETYICTYGKESRKEGRGKEGSWSLEKSGKIL